MKQLICYETDAGPIYIEASIPTSLSGGNKNEFGLELVSNNDDTILKSKTKFENSLEILKPIAHATLTKIRAMVEPPSEVEVSFGIAFKADVGAILAKSGVEASIEVKLVWKKNESDAQKPLPGNH